MENSRNDVTPHPQLLEILFAFKRRISAVFKDILGIYEIDHIALTRINKKNQLLTLSSTPAMEFNLFSSPLWHYDKTYKPQWFQLCTQDYWQNLYYLTRYDELYYLKQIKHAYPIGVTLAAKIDEDYVIYSLASHKSCEHTREIFASKHEDFYKIGQYCSNRLSSVMNSELYLPNTLSNQFSPARRHTECSERLRKTTQNKMNNILHTGSKVEK